MALTVDRLADALGVSRGALLAIKVAEGGAGYDAAAPPDVTLAAPPDGGTQATAAAVVSEAGALTAINVVLRGAGHTSPPAVTVGAPPDGGTQATAAATVDDNEAGRLLTLAGALVDAYRRDPDDTMRCPETVRDEAIIRTAGHVRNRGGFGRAHGRLKVGGAQIDVQPAARGAVRQSGAAALLAPWVKRSA